MSNLSAEDLDTGTEGGLEFSVKGYFNYVAKEYEESLSTELEIPCIYAEYEYYTVEGTVSTERKIPWSVFSFAKRYFMAWKSGTTTAASPRSLFQYGITPDIPSIESVAFPRISADLKRKKLRHVCLFTAHRDPSNAAIRRALGTDEISGLFPQAVKINLNGASSAVTSAASLRKGLINNLYLNSFCLDSIIKFITVGATEIRVDDYTSESVEASKNGYFYNTTNYYNQHKATSNIVPETVVEGFVGGTYAEGIDDDGDGVDDHPGYQGVEDEPMFYQIDKVRDSQVIQTFYTSVLEANGSSWEIVDTQVIPEKQYIYKCYAWKLKKNYTTTITTEEEEEQDDGTTTTTTTTESVTGKFIVKQTSPVFSKSITIYQPPQPIPEVKFSLFGSVKDKYKIMMTMNLNRNSEDGEFYGFTNDEKNSFDGRNGTFNNYGDKKNFVYESEESKFEIYKMTERPPELDTTRESWKNIPSMVENPLEITGSGVSVSTSLSLKPFPQKYYFVFRAINSYGYPSNPTPIYEVFLTEDSDEVFLNFDSVDFLSQEVDKYTLNKTMMKLMQVIPSTRQLHFDDTNIVGEIEVGGEAITNEDGDQLLGYTNADGQIIETGYVNTSEVPTYYSDVTDSERDLSSELFQPIEMINSLVDVDALPTLGLNTGENSIWTVRDEQGNDLEKGNKFKIRVTSKDTGRKLDLNVKFILKKN